MMAMPRQDIFVVLDKGLPCLLSRPRISTQIVADRRLSEFKAQLEQFAMDARSAPQWVLSGHA
jgi:hypothetical protein